MDGFYFDFADNDGDNYFEDDGTAKDSLPSNDSRFEECLEEDFEEDFEDEINQIPLPRVAADIRVSIPTSQAIAVVGAMIETETPFQAEITEEITEYISLAEARGPVKRDKLPLRPFEQFVQDVLSGKKDIRDPL